MQINTVLAALFAGASVVSALPFDDGTWAAGKYAGGEGQYTGGVAASPAPGMLYSILVCFIF